MPEEENQDIEQEIQQASYKGAKKALSEQESIDFPEVQKVQVENWPEQKERPEIEKVEVTNLKDLKLPEPQVTVNVPEQEPPIINVEKTDITELAGMLQKQSELLMRIAEKETPSLDYEKLEQIQGKYAYRGGAIGPSKVYNTIHDVNKSAINPAIKEFQTDYRLRHAIDIIEDTYGDTVSVDEKKKDLRKWGSNDSVGTSRTTIMTLPTGVTQETLLSTNGITTMSSSSTSDTQNLTLLEGHTRSGTDLTFVANTTVTALIGRTNKALPVSLNRATRARLSSPAVGDIYFHEGGETTDGVPNDLTTVHMMIPAGEIQTQKASTAISAIDYWIITNARVGVLEKTSAWAQARIEIKLHTTATTGWYPITEWITASDSSGSVPFFAADDPYLIVPPNHDVRISAIANTAGVAVTAGINGFLAKII